MNNQIMCTEFKTSDTATDLTPEFKQIFQTKLSTTRPIIGCTFLTLKLIVIKMSFKICMSPPPPPPAQPAKRWSVIPVHLMYLSFYNYFQCRNTPQ